MKSLVTERNDKNETREGSGKSPEKKHEFFTTKCEQRKLLLLLAACKRRNCGPTVGTPVISWMKKVGEAPQNTIIKAPNTFSSFSHNSVQISARKLASALWEFQHYFSSNCTMYLGVNNHRQRAHPLHQGFDHPTLPVDPHTSGSHHHQPASAGSLRRHIAAALMRHHQSKERNKHALQPLSPASYGSSLELAPYNPAATPDGSIELRGRMGDSSYGFKTSTELLKVLNRIWTLEELHASNVALIKALKNELDHSRSKIKELLRNKQENRHEIDDLMKQISQDNLSRKSKEHERLEAALQSVRDELEDERKLRKRSESLHRKLAREVFEIKVALSTTIKELEKERKSGELLEDLCDEFARTISDYGKHGHDDHDNLILHFSESWVDEREQKRDKDKDKSSIVDNLRPEIETFLMARKTDNQDTKDTDHKERRLRRRSLEAIPELRSNVGPSQYQEQEELLLTGKMKGQSPPSVQMSEPRNTPRETDPGSTKTGEGNPDEINMLHKSDIYDSYQKKMNYNEEGQGSNSKTVDKLISELLLSEGGSLPPGYEYKEVVPSNASSLRRNASPVRQWVTRMKSPGPRISESSSKSQSVRENSLKAKLQEPKSKGHRSRLKILKGSS